MESQVLLVGCKHNGCGLGACRAAGIKARVAANCMITPILSNNRISKMSFSNIPVFTVPQKS